MNTSCLKPWVCVVLLCGAVTACSDVPTGPTVAVMPAPGKPFEVFQQDDAYCKQYASQQISGAPGGGQQVAAGAAAGAVIGAVAGTLLGDNRNAAGAGAATGALFGSAAGAGNADRSAAGLQRSYNVAFEQCMYAKGNQVPGFSPSRYPPPPPPAS
jgi:uncharacterized protein YcfJ